MHTVSQITRYILLIFIGLSLVIFVKRALASPAAVPILMYHYIDNNPNPSDKTRDGLTVSPANFATQMNYLATHGFTPITLDTLYAIWSGRTKGPAKPIVLTFDDGYANFSSDAFPILHQYGFHAVAFIPTGLIGDGYFMNWNQIRDIAHSGLVTFESHSVSHANLAKLSAQQLVWELQTSKSTLESQTGYHVQFLAYPYGRSNGYVQQIASQLGYIGGLGTWFSRAYGPSMNMPRIRIGNWSLASFAARVGN